MNKEAIVVVLDVNCTMMKHLRKEQGNPEQRIKTAKDSIRMLLEQKLLHNPKHDFGLVLFGTEATSNALNDSMGDDQYTNVVTDRQLSHIDLEFFRSVQAIEAQENETPKGDMLDGLIVGMDMLCKFVGTKKYKKRIFLITDGEKGTSCSPNEMRDIVRTIKENEIKLNCITLDFCNEIGEDESDEENPDKANAVIKDDTETEAQKKNKELLLEMQDQTGCAIIPAETAIELYRQFKKKEYLTRTKFKGNLEISGDLNIAVQIFAKTREETLPSLKRYSKNVPESNQVDAGKVSVEKTFTEIDDPDQKEVDTQDHAKAYYYGKQLVPVSEEYENFLKPQPKKKKEDDSQDPKSENDIKLEQDGIQKQFKLLGFSDQNNVPRHHFMGGVDVILPVKGAKNERAFAAMVNAMIDTHKVLLAKIIERKNADPKLVVLYPHISKKQPMLYLVQLPTSEDIRDYQFPKLVKATQKQRDAAAKLIQKLDLCQEDPEDGEVEERLEPEETFNPTIQYFNQVVTHKVVNPNESHTIPQLNPAIREYMQPDQEIFQNAAEELEEFDNAFEIVQHEEEEGKNDKKQRVYWRDIIAREEEQLVEEQQMLPGIMTEEQAARLKDKGPDDEDPDAVKQVGSVNPIQDFKKMISDRKVDRVNEAIRQIQSIIERYIRCSLSGDLYEKAFECLKHLRDACVKEDEAPAFNRFLERVKDQFGNGAHRDFFQILIKSKVSLITNDESNISSTVTTAESREFLNVQIQRPTQKKQEKQKKDDDDLDLIE